MRIFAVLALIFCFCSSALAQQEYQEPDNSNLKMTYVKYRLEGPGLNEMGKRPKEIWRATDFDMRTLEPPDTVNRIWPLLIYKAPDTWFINLFDSSGLHDINYGPVFEAYAPVLSFKRDSRLDQFQFGFEMRFIKMVGYESVEKTIWDTLKVDEYNFDLIGIDVTVDVNKKTNNPAMITAIDGDKTYRIIYEDFQTGLKPDSTLFLPPDTTRIKEAD